MFTCSACDSDFAHLTVNEEHLLTKHFITSTLPSSISTSLHILPSELEQINFSSFQSCILCRAIVPKNKIEEHHSDHRYEFRKCCSQKRHIYQYFGGTLNKTYDCIFCFIEQLKTLENLTKHWMQKHVISMREPTKEQLKSASLRCTVCGKFIPSEAAGPNQLLKHVFSYHCCPVTTLERRNSSEFVKYELKFRCQLCAGYGSGIQAAIAHGRICQENINYQRDGFCVNCTSYESDIAAAYKICAPRCSACFYFANLQ